jgi:DNA-binding transcriptional LysR family regulator
MELRHVRYFLAIVDAGSVTAASHLAHVTQPSLSRQLRLFESDLGITLFTRSGGRLALSAAGRQFVPVARDLARRADAAAEAAATLAAGRLQHITIPVPGHSSRGRPVARRLRRAPAEDLHSPSVRGRPGHRH